MKDLPMTRADALGAALRRLRLAADLTQDRVAKDCGMDRSQYAHLEAGRNWPSAERLPALGAAFGLSASELCTAAWEPEQVVCKHASPGWRTIDQLAWRFGNHILTISATPLIREVLVRLTCECADTPLWHKTWKGTNPLEALTLRTEASLLEAVSNHLSPNGNSGSALMGEATVLALGGDGDALNTLDRLCDKHGAAARSADS